METPESLVARNVAELRDERKHRVRSLSEALDGLGRKILPSGITKIENQGRSVDVGDLVALAIALGTNPNRLLLPGRTDGDPIALTPTTHVEPSNAWQWAEGRFPLVTEARRGEPYDPEWHADFIRHTRPADRWVREQHTAMRAAQDVLRRVESLLRDREATPDPSALPEDSIKRLAAEEAPGEVRRALTRLVAEIDDLLAGADGER